MRRWDDKGRFGATPLRAFIAGTLILASAGERASPSPATPADDRPVLGLLAAWLDSLVPHASGLFLAEVTAITEHDERPVDGDLYERAEFRVLRSSGEILGAVHLVKASGGFSLKHDPLLWPRRARQPRPEPRFTVRPGEFRVGHRYWLATAARYDFDYPQRVARYWPDSAGVDPRLAQAIELDAYRWHPEFWPEPGFTVGWVDNLADKTSQAWAWLGPQLLWERRHHGILTHNLVNAWYVHRGNQLGNLSPPNLPDTAWVLLAEVRTMLDSTNGFGVPARSWRIQHGLDLRTGRIVASRVRVDQPSDVERVYHAYDERTWRVTYERVEGWLVRGGRAVGAGSEEWLRRIERWFDVRTGRLEREEVSRFAQVRISQSGTASTWLKVDKRGSQPGQPGFSGTVRPYRCGIQAERPAALGLWDWNRIARELEGAKA